MKELQFLIVILFITACGGGKTPPNPQDEDNVGGASSNVESITTIQIITPTQVTEVSIRIKESSQIAK